MKAFFKGSFVILPFALVTVPWGVLTGSMATQMELSFYKTCAMALLIFAGAAQLLSLTLIQAHASVFVILISTFFITLQHLIYALHFRNDLIHQPIQKRLLFGFLLTDELFAIGIRYPKEKFQFLLGAGLCFYFFWFFSNILGIFLSHTVNDLNQYHFDFFIIALFLPIIISLIKTKTHFKAVLITASSMCILNYFSCPSAFIFSSLIGMAAGAFTKEVK
ncbi:AzlC family ABC transporter permease [Acinetobacter sp. HY1485]|uniref:AzlC family ABC transporter permease n=1 Tax=Acinetobacter sp. HY1485 TaxID=2970918 RepID=UPI0022B9D3F1|nr:AzlC family ABC transporter permease [Acinetobacter sp. HY1485]